MRFRSPLMQIVSTLKSAMASFRSTVLEIIADLFDGDARF